MSEKIKGRFVDLLVAGAVLVFSSWLMWHTFQYKNGEILLSSTVWSDFQAHIPLIRSFSLGDNFPPEYPLFPGEKIRYHFLFYLAVGLLEKSGMRLDWALNLPSTLGFAWFMVMIYFLGRDLTKNRAVGIMAVILYLFNGSLSFVKYFTDQGWSWSTVEKIFSLTYFPSFAPYGAGLVSAFWNWNIFINQRHLGLAYALCLTGVYLIWKEGLTWKKEVFKTVGLIIILVILSWLHKAVFLMSTVMYAVLLMTNLRKSVWSFLGLGLGGVLSIPAVLFMSPHAGQEIAMRLGYLSDGTWKGFVWWWFMNMGLVLPGAVLGFVVGNKALKKLFLAFIPLFVIGNTIAFSPDIAANHKFFNLFMVVCVILVANLLALFWKTNWWKRVMMIFIFPVLIFSGIIDMFPIINASYYHIMDRSNQAKNWIVSNTSKDVIFLNSTFFDNPVTLAGRKIFYGWPYFTGSIGYAVYDREKIWRIMWTGEEFCELADRHNVEYLIYDDRKPSSDEPVVNRLFFESGAYYLYQGGGFKILKTSQICLK